MLVSESLCLLLFYCEQSVTNISKMSLTNTIFNIGHQYLCCCQLSMLKTPGSLLEILQQFFHHIFEARLFKSLLKFSSRLEKVRTSSKPLKRYFSLLTAVLFSIIFQLLFLDFLWGLVFCLISWRIIPFYLNRFFIFELLKPIYCAYYMSIIK